MSIGRKYNKFQSVPVSSVQFALSVQSVQSDQSALSDQSVQSVQAIQSVQSVFLNILNTSILIFILVCFNWRLLGKVT